MADINSSARTLQYDLRPAKQVERRLFAEMLQLGAKSGFPLHEAAYVGMGGFKFYDFLMFHRYLNIRRMTSIEGDSNILDRCEFNKPYGFIELYPGRSGEFIAEFDNTSPHIFWLDYDQGIQPDIADDLVALGAKLPSPSFLFLSLKGDPGGPYRKKKSAERLIQMQKDLPTYSRHIRATELSDDGFRWATIKVARRILLNALAGGRAGTSSRELATILYRDGSYMATICYAFGPEPYCNDLSARVRSEMPFLAGDANNVYEIPDFNLSESERRMLDQVATSPAPEARIVKQLSKIGFSESDIGNYRVLLRYLPRYIEAYL